MSLCGKQDNPGAAQAAEILSGWTGTVGALEGPMTPLKRFLAPVVLTAGLLAGAAACGGDELIECTDLCFELEGCFDPMVDRTDCIDSCEDEAEVTIDVCDNCLDESERECSECPGACAVFIEGSGEAAYDEGDPRALDEGEVSETRAPVSEPTW